jgi:hypothetical protein
MVISGIERTYVPTESHQSFRSNPMGHVCIIGDPTDNMGREVNPFEKHQAHCSSTQNINDLVITNTRGFLPDDQSSELGERSFTNTKKKNYVRQSQSVETNEDLANQKRHMIRQKKPVSLLKTPSNLEQADVGIMLDKIQIPRVIEAVDSDKLTRTEQIAFIGASSRDAENIERLKQRPSLV